MDYKSKRWLLKRERVLRAAGYKCQYYKRYGKRIDATMVHHIYPVDQYPEYQWEDWNLVALSNEAHEKMHDRRTGRLTKVGEDLKQKVSPPSGG